MELLNFTPAPSRERHDGWSVADQRKFIGRLARGHSVGEAAKSLGHSRQSAYALKRKQGAEEFARAWIWAQRMGRHASEARRCSPIPDLRAFEMMLVPRFYRGRLVGFVQREDQREVLRAIAELDRCEEEERKLSKLTR
ncbi:MAG: hypothetical protein ACJ8FT_08440 [Sphingomonas sp.]